MAHIERRRQLWYVTLTVPADLRDHFGKFKLIQSLGTPDKREAEILAAPIIARWKAKFRELRGLSNPLYKEALIWQGDIKRAQEDKDLALIVDELLTERIKGIEASKGPTEAETFFGLATGTHTLSSSYNPQWQAQLTVAPKTKDQMVKDVDRFLNKFPTLEQINKKDIKAWLEELSLSGKGIATQKRILSSCRNYWKYLQSHDAVPADTDPFAGVLSFSRSKKALKSTHWTSFTADEIVHLWNKAGEKGDHQLQDLIMLGAYTGARIEELCSLKLADVTTTSLKIADAKTVAGIREVPIHSALLTLVHRLKEKSTDGYLLSGLTFNKYKDRSNAIGKRFGRLKKTEGFSELHVFHSIRKTLTTLLENAGVSENLAADIIGHEKPRITYGLYSGGAALEVMKEAIEKVSYPFDKITP